MKQITNWRKATVADIESDSLLDGATQIHVLGYNMLGTTGKVGSLKGRTEGDRIKKFFQYHIDNKIPVVMHNGIGFDIPLVEKILGMDLKDLMLIDSLSVSWYLNTERQVHGLDSFFADYGIAKPKVKDSMWKAPDKQPWNTDDGHETRLNRHYAIMKHRVTQDVRINVALWEDLMERLTALYSNVKRCVDGGLVDGKRMSDDEVCYIDQYKQTSTVDEYIDRILTFLMFKADCARLKEKTRWKVDVEGLDDLIEDLSMKIEEAKVELESVMPPVAQYAKRKRPAKPFKKNGDLSEGGKKWEELQRQVKARLKDERGTLLAENADVDTIVVLTGYEPPNINGHQQIKDFLFSKGWKPQNFKFVKDEKAQQIWVDSGFKPALKPKPRAIPQVSIDGDEGKELCPSVVKLSEEVPEIMAYAKYTTIKHRLDMCKGWKANLREGGYLCARVGGYTNTLREQHRELVNIPSLKKPLGEAIRSLLIAERGCVLLGSDMSGLEDRVKHHFMLAYDPEYVATMMAPDYDAHLTTALASGSITKEDFDEYMRGNKPPHVVLARGVGKSTNYACLPVDNTRVLTPKGWVSGLDVKVGDLVMGYDVASGCNRWTEVLHAYVYDDAEVVRVGHFDWDVESTRNHRWYGTKRVTEGVERDYKPMIFTTEDINSECNILNSAPFVGGNSVVAPHEAALMAWVLSDGYYKWSERGEGTSSSRGTRKGVIASIAQASHKYQSELESVLEANGVVWTEQKLKSINTNTLKSYVLPANFFRPFFDRVVGERGKKHEVDWVSWVLGLSRDSLEAFVHNFWLADGDSKGREASTYLTFKQNRGNIADALLLAGYLLGHNVTQTGGKCSLIRMQKKRNYTTCQRFESKGTRKTQVFCLTTGLGSFVVKQGKLVTITGNCVYGSGPETLARTSGMTVPQAKVSIEGYWKLNWSVKAIAEDQCVITDRRGFSWLINPVNGFAYSLRTEKDRFSTLCQGTGSFFFDMWIDKILDSMEEVFKVKKLSGTMHDEYISCFRDTEANKEAMRTITEDAIAYVNETYKLRRDLGCDIQFGQNYAQIH